MNIDRFRLFNYRSLKDSGPVYLAASHVTCFAGKNESGKTALLRGLCDIVNARNSLPKEEWAQAGDGEPRARIHLTLLESEIDNIAAVTGVGLDAKAKQLALKLGVELEVTATNVEIIDLPQTAFEYTNDAPKALGARIQEEIAAIRTRFGSVRIPLPEIGEESPFEDAEAFLSAARAKLPHAPDLQAQLDTLASSVTAAKELDDEPDHAFAVELFARLPQFVYLDAFGDVPQYEISLEDAVDDEIFSRFAKLAEIDLNAVLAADSSYERTNMLEGHSANVSGQLNEHWTQEKIELVFRPNGDNIALFIRERGSSRLQMPMQRSKGFRWFLAFYAVIQGMRNVPHVLCIDEPGSYLHASAQKSILQLFNELASSTFEVLYSTHSPYLINSSDLDTVRLVLKRGGLSTIENKYYKGSDSDTIAPLLTAIGLSAGDTLGIGRQYNVIVEGVSDAFYLSAVSTLLDPEAATNFAFIPAVGSSTVSSILAIMLGWGFRVVALFDNDDAGRRESRKLERAFGTDVPAVFVSDAPACIEDLFTRDDFLNVVLAGEEATPFLSEETNSEYCARVKLDKVLLARRFASRARSTIELAEDSLTRFRRVLEEARQRAS